MNADDPEPDQEPVIELPERPRLPEPPRPAYRRPEPDNPLLRGPRGIRVDAAEARGMGAGWNIATALVSSLIAGTLLGMAADRYFIKSETPWGLIVGFLLGTVSGFANVFAIARRLDEPPANKDPRT
ncbi:MAG: AtpZ/AtpI family protein [Armatimonadota bacterium]